MISIVLKLLSRFRCRDYRSNCCSDDRRTYIYQCPACHSHLRLSKECLTDEAD